MYLQISLGVINDWGIFLCNSERWCVVRNFDYLLNHFFWSLNSPIKIFLNILIFCGLQEN